MKKNYFSLIWNFPFFIIIIIISLKIKQGKYILKFKDSIKGKVFKKE